MTDKDFELKLKEYDLKLSNLGLENERWHHDFNRREKHRTRQTLFWVCVIVLAAASAGAAIARLFV